MIWLKTIVVESDGWLGRGFRKRIGDEPSSLSKVNRVARSERNRAFTWSGTRGTTTRLQIVENARPPVELVQDRVTLPCLCFESAE